MSKSELEPLESAIKEPRKFASDVVCQDGLYDALHTSSLRPSVQDATYARCVARAVVIHVAVVMFVLVCLSSCKLVASRCMCLWPCRAGPHGRPWEGCAAHRVATAFRCGAPDQASVAAPTGSWRPLVVKLLAHDRAEPLQEGAPLDAALQAWKKHHVNDRCARRSLAAHTCMYLGVVRNADRGRLAGSECPATGPVAACFAPSLGVPDL